MYKIRVVKTASGASAVQVVRYQDRKRIVVKHIGSAHSQQQLAYLKRLAERVIRDLSRQMALFEDEHGTSRLLHLEQSEFRGVHLTFLYEGLLAILGQIGFEALNSRLMLDLVVIRVVEPASKLRSIELLADYFGVYHRRQGYYDMVEGWAEFKSVAETCAVQFAKQQYGFDYNLVFYDVTTLYFETFQEDGFRENGFSKDNKPQQPQVVVALMVDKNGFPVAYEVFNGSTFEGHTFIPVIEAFIKKHGVRSFTVVADAAMISHDNINALTGKRIHYIVGARLANLPATTIEKIDRGLPRQDGSILRLKTKNGYLICSFSTLRYKKDKHEMEKQVERAKQAVSRPSKNKRLKFTKSKNQQLELNQALIAKTETLLGIKGYYTDLTEKEVPSREVIDRYHELYKIEQAFRISKHDLKTRPVYHYKEGPIQLHLLICFMALAASKHIELATDFSIKKFVTECKKIQDARMFNKITGEELKIRTNYSPVVVDFIKKLNLPH